MNSDIKVTRMPKKHILNPVESYIKHPSPLIAIFFRLDNTQIYVDFSDMGM